jgi:hypothetical protein
LKIEYSKYSTICIEKKRAIFPKRPQNGPHALKLQKIKFIGDKTSVRRGQKNTYEAGWNCGKIHFAASATRRREKKKQHSNIALGRIANMMPVCW